MVFVFTAVILFFTFLFWNIVRLNRSLSQHKRFELGDSKDTTLFRSWSHPSYRRK